MEIDTSYIMLIIIAVHFATAPSTRIKPKKFVFYQLGIARQEEKANSELRNLSLRV